MLFSKINIVLILLYLKLIDCSLTMKQAVVVYKNKDTAYPTLPTHLQESLFKNFLEVLKFKYPRFLPKNFDLGKWSIDLGHKMEPAQLKFYESKFRHFIHFDESYYNATAGDKNTEEFASSEDCPAYNEELDKFLNSIKYKIANYIYQPLMKNISMHTNVDINSFSALEKLYTSIDKQPLKQWPAWIKKINPYDLYLAACYSFAIPTDTPKLARLSIGSFIKHIINTMVTPEGVYKRSMRKIRFYRADSYTVAGILNAMEMYNFRCPEEYSAIFFELHKDISAGRTYLSMFYRNFSNVKYPEQLDIPRCGKLCPIDKFMTVYEGILPGGRNSECYDTHAMKEIIAVVMLLLCFVAILCYTPSTFVNCFLALRKWTRNIRQRPREVEIEMVDMNV